jgi:hypothetical protein
MQKSQQSWVRCQHPPTQCMDIEGAADESVLNNLHEKVYHQCPVTYRLFPSWLKGKRFRFWVIGSECQVDYFLLNCIVFALIIPINASLPIITISFHPLWATLFKKKGKLRRFLGALSYLTDFQNEEFFPYNIFDSVAGSD